MLWDLQGCGRIQAHPHPTASGHGTPVPRCELPPEHPALSEEVEPPAYQTRLLQRCFIYVVLPWPRQQEPLASIPAARQG